MLYIPTNVKIDIEWSVKKGVGNEAEDFSRSTVSLFLFSDENRWTVPCTADYTGTVRAELPETLPEGVYSLELIWVKNDRSINETRCIQRTRKTCVFVIDAAAVLPASAQSRALPGLPDIPPIEAPDPIPTVKMVTVAAPYGYDGLSAYESAVLRGKTNLSEEEWLEAASKGTVALDTLESYDKNAALSANKGRELAEGLQAQQTQYQDLSAELNKVRDSLDGKLAALIADAPEELDTLKEVADYIAEDMAQREQMQSKLDILYKVSIGSFNGANYKKGTTPTHTFSWSVSVNNSAVQPLAQSIQIGSDSPISLATNVRNYKVTPTSDTTYKLTIDGVTKTATIKFYPPTYLGLTASSFNSTPTAEAVQTVAQLTVYGPTTQSRTFSSSDTTNKLCIACPSVLTVTIKDGFGTDVHDTSFTKSAVTIDGDNYTVYVLTDPAALNGVKYSITIKE